MASHDPGRFFVLRTPVLSFDEFLRGNGDLRSLRSSDELAEGTLIGLDWTEPKLVDWLAGLDVPLGGEASFALAARCGQMVANLGLNDLSITSTGRIGSSTSVALEARKRCRRATHLKVWFVERFARHLAGLLGAQGKVQYRVNPTLFCAGEIAAIAGFAPEEEGPFAIHLARFQLTPDLRAVLKSAQSGATLDELASELAAQDDEVSAADAAEYLSDLCNSQLIVSTFGPSSTGPESTLHPTLAGLENVGGTQAVTSWDAIQADFARLDAQGPGAPVWEYSRIDNAIRELGTPSPRARPYCVHLARPATHAVVGREVIDEIFYGAQLLARTTRPTNRMRRFCAAFVTRYGDESVPLLEALDEQRGIGFDSAATPSEGSPLLESLSFPEPTDRIATWGNRERLLTTMIGNCLYENSRTIALSSAELNQLSLPDPLPLPRAFSVVASLAAPSQQAISEGNFQVRIDQVVGANANAELALLAHTDSNVRELVERLVRAEELGSDAIFAEVVHLPCGLEPNQCPRPSFRQFEIPLLGRSGAPLDRQIPPADLYLSIVGDVIRMFSARLGREVIPRVTSPGGYDARRDLGIYRFLCELAHQGTSGSLSWSWGTLEDAPFLPRVETGRLVLSRARWKLKASQLELPLRHSPQTDCGRAIMSELGLPRFVEIVEHARRTLFDLDEPGSTQAFAWLLQRKGQAIVEELLPAPERLCIQGPEGRFVHQLIVPFVSSEGAVSQSASPLRSTIQRSFSPGSEWLLVELRCNVRTMDELLIQTVAPVLERATHSKAIDSWFFVRYYDSGWQLRLFIRDRARRVLTRTFSELRDALSPHLDARRIWDLTLGTYHREIRRYGGEQGVAIAEQIFCLDTAAVIPVLRGLATGLNADARWRLTLVGIDRFLNDLGLDPTQKRSAMKSPIEDLAKRFQPDAALREQLERRFQTEAPVLRALLSSDPRSADSQLAPFLEFFSMRSLQLTAWVDELRILERDHRLSKTIFEQAPSYIHMFCNRLLLPESLPQEFVLYDFVRRLYEEP